MSRVCAVCGKGQMTGHKVSHSNIKTNRTFKPNVHKVTFVNKEGKIVNAYVCARCLRKVERCVKTPSASKKEVKKFEIASESVVEEIVATEAIMDEGTVEETANEAQVETAENEETDKSDESSEKNADEGPVEDLI